MNYTITTKNYVWYDQEEIKKKSNIVLEIFMMKNNKEIGTVKMYFTNMLERYDELYELQNIQINDSDYWPYIIKDNMKELNLQTPHVLLSWISIDIRYRRKGHGKTLLNESLKIAKETFPTIKWVYLYRVPLDNENLLNFYTNLGFTDTGFKGIMYKLF